MESTPPDFDAADVADAIFGLDEPETTSELPVTPNGRSVQSEGRNLGWVLLFLLGAAVSIAISLAVQLDQSSPRTAPPCGGLYSDCCAEWDEDWGPCVEPCDDRDVEDDRERDDRRGLFDAEEHFAERRLPPRC